MVVFGAIVKKPQIRVVMSDLNDRVRAVFDRCSESPRPARCAAGPRFVPIDPGRPRPTSEHQPPAGRDRTLRHPLVAASALDGSRLDLRKTPGAQRLGRLNTPARGRLRPPHIPARFNPGFPVDSKITLYQFSA